MLRRNRLRGKRKLRQLRRRKAGGWRVSVGQLAKGTLTLAVLASLTFLGFTGYQYLERSGHLRVGEVRVEGCMNATEEELLKLVKANLRDSLGHLDLPEITRRLSRHPWVEKAKVRRDWSRKAVIIEVQERMPQALILLDDLYLVDRNGEVFKKAGFNDQIDLPVLTGLKNQEVWKGDPQALEGIRQALDLLQILKKRKIFTPLEVSEIHVSRRDGLTLFTLNGGMPIRLGIGEFEDKINRLEKVLPDLQRRFPDVEYLDLHYSRKVVAKMKEPENEKSRRSG